MKSDDEIQGMIEKALEQVSAAIILTFGNEPILDERIADKARNVEEAKWN